MRIVSPVRRLPALLLAALSSTPAVLTAQATRPATAKPPMVVGTVPAAMSLVTQADLKRDLYTMAGLDMRGREAGTLDEMRASVWTADQLKKIGVAPAGTDGSYFQWFNMRRTRVSVASTHIYLAGRTLALWSDIAVNGNAQFDVRGRTVFAGDGSDTTINVFDKVAVATLAAPARAVAKDGTNSYEYRYTTAAMTNTANRLARRGASAVILVADSMGDKAFAAVSALRSRGAYDVEGGMPRNGPVDPRAPRPPDPARSVAPPAQPPVFLVRSSMLETLRKGNDSAHLRVRTEVFQSPSTNIVGVIRGTDPKLRDEYVLYSSHQDHDGVRFDIDGDSVWSGADDNGTVSVALLAIARAMVKQPPKRSVLFVYHGAEERGLLGSRYHAMQPVVPLANIVAVLNGDMIGRNHPDSASILGVQPPHRNSTELVEMALRANELTGKFKLDSIWDRPTHPEGWYFRSDHLPYARLNVPALMYSTNLHADYHTPRDKPERIDYAKLTRMTQWMYLTGWMVANNPKRPAVDPGFKLER
ncbi:MAG TPA: M28 family peptidase [Gemmatimonas sp.]|nr:M28 family peptidase [Gemmatimonas sp.]